MKPILPKTNEHTLLMRTNASAGNKGLRRRQVRSAEYERFFVKING